MTTKTKQRPSEYPTETFKEWKRQLNSHRTTALSFDGDYSEIKKQSQRVNVWAEIKEIMDLLRKEAKSARVQGLRFEVRDRTYYEETSIEVTAIGYRQKTEREMIAGELARERNRERRESEARKKSELEKKQLKELLSKYPELANPGDSRR
jgi:hypothetical protein